MKKKMKGESCNLSIVICAVLHIVSWLSVASSSRPFIYPDYDFPTVHQPSGTTQKSHTLGINLSLRKVVRLSRVINTTAEERGSTSTLKGVLMNKLIGSSPPSCEHKCYGCSPCEATQVPTTKAHLQIQFANYIPEGWKCRCGPSFYTP